eukprot:14562488-Alexandrium_andersonii.AAC.1
MLREIGLRRSLANRACSLRARRAAHRHQASGCRHRAHARPTVSISSTGSTSSAPARTIFRTCPSVCLSPRRLSTHPRPL